MLNKFFNTCTFFLIVMILSSNPRIKPNSTKKSERRSSHRELHKQEKRENDDFNLSIRQDESSRVSDSRIKKIKTEDVTSNKQSNIFDDHIIRNLIEYTEFEKYKYLINDQVNKLAIFFSKNMEFYDPVNRHILKDYIKKATCLYPNIESDDMYALYCELYDFFSTFKTQISFRKNIKWLYYSKQIEETNEMKLYSKTLNKRLVEDIKKFEYKDQNLKIKEWISEMVLDSKIRESKADQSFFIRHIYSFRIEILKLYHFYRESIKSGKYKNLSSIDFLFSSIDSDIEKHNLELDTFNVDEIHTLQDNISYCNHIYAIYLQLFDFYISTKKKSEVKEGDNNESNISQDSSTSLLEGNDIIKEKIITFKHFKLYLFLTKKKNIMDEEKNIESSEKREYLLIKDKIERALKKFNPNSSEEQPNDFIYKLKRSKKQMQNNRSFLAQQNLNLLFHYEKNIHHVDPDVKNKIISVIDKYDEELNEENFDTEYELYIELHDFYMSLLDKESI